MSIMQTIIEDNLAITDNTMALTASKRIRDIQTAHTTPSFESSKLGDTINQGIRGIKQWFQSGNYEYDVTPVVIDHLDGNDWLKYRGMVVEAGFTLQGSNHNQVISNMTSAIASNVDRLLKVEAYIDALNKQLARYANDPEVYAGASAPSTYIIPTSALHANIDDLQKTLVLTSHSRIQLAKLWGSVADMRSSAATVNRINGALSKLSLVDLVKATNRTLEIYDILKNNADNDPSRAYLIYMTEEVSRAARLVSATAFTIRAMSVITDVFHDAGQMIKQSQTAA